jgi:hypothetical protein
MSVKAWVEGFTTEGRRPRAKLVVEADGEAAEYRVYLVKGGVVKLSFATTNRAEAERGAAVLRAAGVRAEVEKTYNKRYNRDEWRIQAYANALAAESVHEAVRRAVVEFLRRCREAGALSDGAYRRLAAKFENGLPEWGEVRFSVRLRGDNLADVLFDTDSPQAFKRAVEFLKSLGMRNTCRGGLCISHFTAREPEGGSRSYVRITADGLRYIGWLASRGDERAQRLREALLKEAGAKSEGVRRLLERRFREGEQWGSVKPPFEREVEVEGRRLRVRVEEVGAVLKRGRREWLVVEVRAEVGGSATAKEIWLYGDGRVRGYVDGGRGEEERLRTAALLKALGIMWSMGKTRFLLSSTALAALMRLEPVCRLLLS